MFLFRCCIQLLSAILLVACAREPRIAAVADRPSAVTEQPIAPPAGTPFVGFKVKPHPDGGAVVERLVAGPAALAGMALNDRIVRISDQDADAAQIRAIITASSPGDVLLIHLERGGAPITIDVRVGKREHWLGPSAHPSVLAVVPATSNEAENWLDDNLATLLTDQTRIGSVDAGLTKMFHRLAYDTGGHNKLPLQRLVLADPGEFIVLQEQVTLTARSTLTDRLRLYPLFCSLLALKCASQSEAVARAERSLSLAELAGAISVINRDVRKAFEAIPGGRRALAADFMFLLEETSAGRFMFNQAEVIRGIRAMQRSMTVDLESLVEAFKTLLVNADGVRVDASDAPLENSVPPSVATGEIRAHLTVDEGYIILGGDGPNRYDMDRIYAVIDEGGDDEYVWRNAIPLETQMIIDDAGDDRYDARHGGPGTGWLGVGVLIDRAGDDSYRATLASCGAGAFGFGALIDLSGVDLYRCDAWSLGAGIYGAGALIDAGERGDTYVSQIFSQGVGGPRGAGVLVEAGGADLYRANGMVRSVYGTPATFMGMSQGVGVGIRPHDHGGTGVLLDLAGNGRYDGGEFSQGGGYYWGIGILQDEAGDDLYYGTHYAQGFAAHQAAGLLADLGGNDYYLSSTAGAQGAAWDQSLAILFEGGGGDHYRAEDLSQGAAAHQSRAWLYDASGDDNYWSRTATVQGATAGNAYHFNPDDPVFSFAVLMDVGAGDDRYSSELEAGETRVLENLDAQVDGSGTIGIAVAQP